MVAQYLAAAPHQAHYGYGVAQALGLDTGLVFPLLQRLYDAGWLTDSWEDPRECNGRPARRYFRLTSDGRKAMIVIAGGGKPPAPVQHSQVTARGRS